MGKLTCLAAAGLGFAIAFAPQAHASLIAAYTFDGTLAAVEGGQPALVAVDPLGTSKFETETVFGNSQNTWHFDGASTSANNGGLSLNVSGMGITDAYSVEMVVELTGNTGWRRLLDSQDRQSDAGLYIDPNNNLDSFPNGGSGSLFSPNKFFDIFVTVDSGKVAGYFSGNQEFSDSSTSLNISSNTLNFFLDNTAAGGQNEWSSGNVALIKVFDTALTPQQVADETADPFQGTTAPEPGTLSLLLGSLAAGVLVKSRRRRQA